MLISSIGAAVKLFHSRRTPERMQAIVRNAVDINANMLHLLGDCIFKALKACTWCTRLYATGSPLPEAGKGESLVHVDPDQSFDEISQGMQLRLSGIQYNALCIKCALVCKCAHQTKVSTMHTRDKM